MKLTPCILIVVLATVGCAQPAPATQSAGSVTLHPASEPDPIAAYAMQPMPAAPAASVPARPPRKPVAKKPPASGVTTVAAVAKAKAQPAPAAPVAPDALSPEAERLNGWIAASRDNQGTPYIVIDKRRARLWVFDARRGLLGSTPILLGAARGDHTVPGIGERPLERVAPWERTTPAGRFVIEPGRNLRGEDIFWVDYEAAVSMHRVRATNPTERRLQRLASPSAADNRISWGCINVPVAFFEGVIQPNFSRKRGIVYILPEQESPRQVFATLAERAGDVPIRATLLAEMREEVGTALRRFESAPRP